MAKSHQMVCYTAHSKLVQIRTQKSSLFAESESGLDSGVGVVLFFLDSIALVQSYDYVMSLRVSLLRIIVFYCLYRYWVI